MNWTPLTTCAAVADNDFHEQARAGAPPFSCAGHPNLQLGAGATPDQLAIYGWAFLRAQAARYAEVAETQGDRQWAAGVERVAASRVLALMAGAPPTR